MSSNVTNEQRLALRALVEAMATMPPVMFDVEAVARSCGFANAAEAIAHGRECARFFRGDS